MWEENLFKVQLCKVTLVKETWKKMFKVQSNMCHLQWKVCVDFSFYGKAKLIFQCKFINCRSKHRIFRKKPIKLKEIVLTVIDALTVTKELMIDI